MRLYLCKILHRYRVCINVNISTEETQANDTCTCACTVYILYTCVVCTCTCRVNRSTVYRGMLSRPGKSSMSPDFRLKQAPCHGQRTWPLPTTPVATYNDIAWLDDSATYLNANYCFKLNSEHYECGTSTIALPTVIALAWLYTYTVCTT